MLQYLSWDSATLTWNDVPLQWVFNYLNRFISVSAASRVVSVSAASRVVSVSAVSRVVEAI